MKEETKKKIKEDVFIIAVNILIGILLFLGFLYCTSAEAWYSGTHDSQHEGENCRCHERLVALDKERGEER